jgi:hypothetical protein
MTNRLMPCGSEVTIKVKNSLSEFLRISKKKARVILPPVVY